MNRKALFLILILAFQLKAFAVEEPKTAYIIILGVAQDGGYPHMGCQKECCAQAWKNPTLRRNVVSLALVDPVSKKWWLFEATPDIKQQLQDFSVQTQKKYAYLPEGVFITHAHIGHYTGLMQFGREVMNTKELKVYVLPKLKSYLAQNGPWNQLVKLHNINLIELKVNTPLNIANNSVSAFTVPHRDEYAETAGFKIITPTKKYLFIPDIDKWNKWDKNIVAEIKDIDVAFLDATFYTNTELGNRAIAEVPHPLVTETEALLAKEDSATKKKIYFIHFNHTNPLLWQTAAQEDLLKKGFNLAKQAQMFH
ncbi:MAG: MBL fold metallo-hydrolase [Bacteroidota bacterium]